LIKFKFKKYKYYINLKNKKYFLKILKIIFNKYKFKNSLILVLILTSNCRITTELKINPINENFDHAKYVLNFFICFFAPCEHVLEIEILFSLKNHW